MLRNRPFRFGATRKTWRLEELRRHWREPWGHVCMPCPTGGDCSALGTTFQDIKSTLGYWSVKYWYAGNVSDADISVDPPNMEYTLKYRKCPETEDSLFKTTCVGGDSVWNTTSLDTNRGCRYLPCRCVICWTSLPLAPLHSPAIASLGAKRLG